MLLRPPGSGAVYGQAGTHDSRMEAGLFPCERALQREGYDINADPSALMHTGVMGAAAWQTFMQGLRRWQPLEPQSWEPKATGTAQQYFKWLSVPRMWQRCPVMEYACKSLQDEAFPTDGPAGFDGTLTCTLIKTLSMMTEAGESTLGPAAGPMQAPAGAQPAGPQAAGAAG